MNKNRTFRPIVRIMSMKLTTVSDCILYDTNLEKTEDKTILKRLDFAPIWVHNDFPYLGFRGENFQRLQIKFLDITKSNKDADVYYVSGKTKIKGRVNSFSGTIKILTINTCKPLSWRLMSENIDKKYAYKYKGLKCHGRIVAVYFFAEDNKQEESGIFSGTLYTDWFIDRKGKLQYDDVERHYSDPYCNNQFVGTWQSYNSESKLTCNWGHDRIPFSEDLDIGGAEFCPADKYLRYGWQTYRAPYKNEEELKHIIEMEENWWKNGTRSTFQYVLYRAHTYNSGKNINKPAKLSNNWTQESFKTTVDKFAPDTLPISNVKGTKLIYTNKETGIQVVYDKKHNYFRIKDREDYYLNTQGDRIHASTGVSGKDASDYKEDDGYYLTLPISREDLGELSKEDFFETINDRFNLKIDEYEEEALLDLDKVTHLLKWLKNATFKNNLCEFYAKKLAILLEKAITLNTGADCSVKRTENIVALAIIGIAQIAAGAMIVACTGGALGKGFISEGVADLIAGVKAGIDGTFDWGKWAIQKAVSITVALFTSGIEKIKEAWKNVKGTVDKLTGAVKTVGGEVVKETSKAITQK
eukprot:gene5044-6276_t